MYSSEANHLDRLILRIQRWADTRRLSRFPRTPSRQLGRARVDELTLFQGRVRALPTTEGPLIAPLSGVKTLGFVLEVGLGGSDHNMAVGALDALEFDDGSAKAFIPRCPAVVLGAERTGPAQYLHGHLGSEVVLSLFRHRGLDLPWASRRNISLLIREYRLPAHLPGIVWVAARIQAAAATGQGSPPSADGRLILRRGAHLPITLATSKPSAAIAESAASRRLLLAQRSDRLLDELIIEQELAPSLYP